MMAMTLRSLCVKSSARIAPTPADGSVDRIVIGWIKLSYRCDDCKGLHGRLAGKVEEPPGVPKSYNEITGQSLERLAALSDGIFAVAMTERPARYR